MSFWNGFHKRADDVVSEANAAAQAASSSNPVATSVRNAFGSNSPSPGILSSVGSAISNAFSGPSLGSTITQKIKNVQGGEG